MRLWVKAASEELYHLMIKYERSMDEICIDDVVNNVSMESNANVQTRSYSK